MINRRRFTTLVIGIIAVNTLGALFGSPVWAIRVCVLAYVVAVYRDPMFRDKPKDDNHPEGK